MRAHTKRCTSRLGFNPRQTGSCLCVWADLAQCDPAGNWKPKRIRLDTADPQPCRLYFVIVSFFCASIDLPVTRFAQNANQPLSACRAHLWTLLVDISFLLFVIDCYCLLLLVCVIIMLLIYCRYFCLPSTPLDYCCIRIGWAAAPAVLHPVPLPLEGHVAHGPLPK